MKIKEKNIIKTHLSICLTHLIVAVLTNFIVIHKSWAQKTNGTVNSLIETETYFKNLAKKKGLNTAFIEMASINGVVFRPNPVNAKDYYHKEEPANFELTWSPDYAMIAKNGCFGFTSGLYEFNIEDKKIFGHYLTIWKAGKNKKWKLELDAAASHPKPLNNIPPQFIDPPNYKYPKLIGPKKVKMREDIVFSTDLLLSKALEKSGNRNFKEFYADNVRLYFPGHLPVIGKQEVLKFIDYRNQHIKSNPTFTDRAFSGDLAYTNGKATIGMKKYNYIRIWQIDEEMKWNILVDMYIEE